MDFQERGQARRLKVFNLMLLVLKKFYLEFLDFLGVITCIWTAFWLLYMCFLRDFLDIALYAALKLGGRIFWVLNISGISGLLKSLTSFEKLINLTHHDSLGPDDVFETSPARISVTLSETDRQQQPLSSTPSPKCTLVNPRSVRLNSDDKQQRDVAYVSPVQQSYIRRKFFGKGFFRRDTYTPHNYSLPEREFRRLQETIRRTPSAVRGDREHLILNESPEGTGCFKSVISFFSKRFFAHENNFSMHYQRF